MNRTDSSSTGVSKEIEGKSRVSDWFNKEEEIENNPFYKNKYFIWGSFLLISGVTYYYFGDEIKVFTISLWGYLRGRRPGDNPPNNDNILENRYNSWVNLIGWNRNNTKDLNITDMDDEIILFESSNPADLASSSSTNIEPIINKGKEVLKSPVNLTSPSLDDLNAKVEDTWSRATSPESVSSSATVKPTILTKTEVINNSSTNIFKHDEIPKLVIDTSAVTSPTNFPLTPENYIDQALTPNETNLKPFVDVEEINGKLDYIYNEDNWMDFSNQGFKDRINFIETISNKADLKDLDPKTIEKLQDKSCDLVIGYNNFVEAFEDKRANFDDQTIQPLKLFGFSMRNWLQKHLNLIWKDENINIPVGNKLDSPIEITKDIFDVENHQSFSDSDSE